eukprot:gene9716-11516_t
MSLCGLVSFLKLAGAAATLRVLDPFCHQAQIKRKNRTNVVSHNVFENFIKKKAAYSSVDVCGYTLVTNMLDEVLTRENQETARTEVEYYDNLGLKNYLFYGEKPTTGILQKFVIPKEDHNSMIRATWSPQVCLLERRTNTVKLTDKTHELYERCVTFEGPERHSDSSPLTGSALAASLQHLCKQLFSEADLCTLQKSIQTLCNEIVNHVRQVSGNVHNITRMVCNFKMDPDGRVWFLWCSSLRLVPAGAEEAGEPPRSAPINLNPKFLIKPQSKLIVQAKQGTPVMKNVSFRCPYCLEINDMRYKYEVTYKSIIAQWQKDQSKEQRNRERAAEANGDVPDLLQDAKSPNVVPPVIRACEPRITSEKKRAPSARPKSAKPAAIAEEDAEASPREPLYNVGSGFYSDFQTRMAAQGMNTLRPAPIPSTNTLRDVKSIYSKKQAALELQGGGVERQAAPVPVVPLRGCTRNPLEDLKASELTMSQEELVRQAVFSAAQLEPAEAPSYRVELGELDTLLDDLASESSGGSAAMAWGALLAQQDATDPAHDHHRQTPA